MISSEHTLTSPVAGRTRTPSERISSSPASTGPSGAARNSMPVRLKSRSNPRLGSKSIGVRRSSLRLRLQLAAGAAVFEP